MYMEEMLEYIFLGVPTIQTVVKHAWIKFDLTFHLILDVS